MNTIMMMTKTTAFAEQIGSFIWNHPVYSYLIADVCVAAAYLTIDAFKRAPYPSVGFGCVKNMKNEEDFHSTIAKEGVVIVDFYAEWCGPCARAVPEYAHLSTLYGPKGIKFCKVDTDQLRKLSEAEGVDAMPTFKIYKSGVCIATTEGFQHKDIVKELDLLISDVKPKGA